MRSHLDDAPVIFWLAGRTGSKNYIRLCQIIEPVLSLLGNATTRPYRSGGFENGSDAINIWLSSEVDDFPPTSGTNILWFLENMKIIPRATLDHFDAILTSSPNHHQFLRSFLSPAKHVDICKCPFKPQLGIACDPTGPITVRGLKETDDLFTDPRYNYIGPLDDICSQLNGARAHVELKSLRERMCGFENIEELSALSCGIPVISDHRKGIQHSDLRHFIEFPKNLPTPLIDDATLTKIAPLQTAPPTKRDLAFTSHAPHHVAEILKTAIDAAATAHAHAHAHAHAQDIRKMQRSDQGLAVARYLFVDDIGVARLLRKEHGFDLDDTVADLKGYLLRIPDTIRSGHDCVKQTIIFCILKDRVATTRRSESAVFLTLAKRYFARQALWAFTQNHDDILLDQVKDGTDLSAVVGTVVGTLSTQEKRPAINDWTQPLENISTIIFGQNRAAQPEIRLRKADVFPRFDKTACLTTVNDLGIPWVGVLKASLDADRIYNLLSRRLNNHNIYDFISRLEETKQLSPFLKERDTHQNDKLPNFAVFIHAFYLDELGKILETYGPNAQTASLFLSTDTAEKKLGILAILKDHGLRAERVDVVENVGRDIYPKLVHFAKDHDRFDYVLHLHTKKSPHSASLQTWSDRIAASLTSSPDRVHQILSAFEDDPSLGMVYPDPPLIIQPAMAWTRNHLIADWLAAKLNRMTLPESADLEFPAGSMFWARTAALRPILDLDLTADNFPLEDGQEDGTLAHTIERMLGVIVREQGYKMARVAPKPLDSDE